MEKTIDKEVLNALPTKNFSGNVIVANTVEQADAAVMALRESGAIVGFDTETRPAFQKGVTYKVCLIQLSAGQTAYLFRLNKIGTIPQSLKDLLEDGKVVKVGISIHDDFNNLRKWGPLEPKGFIELQHLVTSYGIADQSLAKIYGIVFGLKISKRQRLTNWEADHLTDKQIEYAALDAVACVEIYNALLTMGKQIINQGR